MKFSRVAMLLSAGAMMGALAAVPVALAGKKKAEPPCIKGKTLTAFQMRMLQTELVVGALSCKLTPRYNDFVTAYRPELMTAHRGLMAYFGRESQLEDYKSRTANEVSQRSLANITEFCLYTSALYDRLLGPERVQLATFVSSEPAANRHGQNACATPALVTASVGGKTVPLPRMKPDMPAVAAAAPATPAGTVPPVMPTPKPEIVPASSATQP